MYRVVCLRVCARGVEHAFDRVRGAGDVGSAFDRCERGRDQHHQEADDADDDEQFEERKAPGRPRSAEVRSRRSDVRFSIVDCRFTYSFDIDIRVRHSDSPSCDRLRAKLSKGTWLSVVFRLHIAVRYCSEK